MDMNIKGKVLRTGDIVSLIGRVQHICDDNSCWVIVGEGKWECTQIIGKTSITDVIGPAFKVGDKIRPKGRPDAVLTVLGVGVRKLFVRLHTGHEDAVVMDAYEKVD